MTTQHKFLLLLLRIFSVFPFVVAEVLQEQKFAMEPQDQTTVVGTRVTLPCRVIGKSGILQWTKDDFGLGTHRNLSGFDRYTMIGSDEEGMYIYFHLVKMYLLVGYICNVMSVLENTMENVEYVYFHHPIFE